MSKSELREQLMRANTNIETWAASAILLNAELREARTLISEGREIVEEMTVPDEWSLKFRNKVNEWLKKTEGTAS